MTTVPSYSWLNLSPNATLHYIRHPDQANPLLATLSGPVGFDLEWKPTFTKNTPENPVALVQLANRNTILLIQISAMQEFPEKLRDFLESPDFVKAGVAIQSDVIKLYKDWGVSTRNCVDLSLLARCVDNARWKGKYNSPLGLARLIEVYENLALPKDKTSRSNWEGDLTSRQIEYAANDAHSGFVIYERLIAMANAMENVPKPVYYTFDAVRGRLCEPTGMHWNCYNPDYDPGPLPPPKPPKPPTARDLRRAALRARVAASTTTSAAVPGSAPNYLTFSGTTEPTVHSTPLIPGSQRYFPSRNSADAHSSSSYLSPPRRHPWSHYLPPPATGETSVSNNGAHPYPGTFPIRSGLFLAETKQPSVNAPARAFPQYIPTDNAQVGPDAGHASSRSSRRRPQTKQGS